MSSKIRRVTCVDSSNNAQILFLLGGVAQDGRELAHDTSNPRRLFLADMQTRRFDSKTFLTPPAITAMKFTGNLSSPVWVVAAYASNLAVQTSTLGAAHFACHALDSNWPFENPGKAAAIRHKAQMLHIALATFCQVQLIGGRELDEQIDKLAKISDDPVYKNFARQLSEFKGKIPKLHKGMAAFRLIHYMATFASCEE